VKRIVHRIGRTRRGGPLVAAIFLTGAFVSGCETSSTISEGPNPVKCRVTLATPPPLDAAAGAGSLAVTTQPECVWDAVTTADWISALSPTSGQGSATVSFRVAANEGAAPRDGAIVVNGEQAHVSQRAPCRYDVSPSTYGTGASGGSTTLSIATSSECAWTASSDVTWITFTSSTTGNGNGSVGFAVAASRDDVRSGTIVVANQRIVVTQASGVPPPPPPPPTPPPPVPPPPPACTYSLSRTSDFVGASDGTGEVNVSTTSTCTWTAVTNAVWITVAPGVRTGSGRVDYHYTPNPGALRTGTLTIAGLTFTVTQPQAP
jgi:Putative binding domain, N-terminal